MKKAFQVFAAAVISVALASVTAGAQSSAACTGTLEITGTGASSTNIINCTDITNVVITCVNNVNIATVNLQGGSSGTATVNGNTTGGGATSGNVINTNATNVDASAACGATTVASPTPTPTPATPGQGGAKPTTPKALPNTANDSALSIVAASLFAGAAIVIASRLAAAAFRRIGSK